MTADLRGSRRDGISRNSSINNSTRSSSTQANDHHNDPVAEELQKLLDALVPIILSQLPKWKKVGYDLFDMIFHPEHIMKQITLLIAFETSIMITKQIIHISDIVVSKCSTQQRRLIQQLEYKQLYETKTQDEWMEIAECIDKIQYNDIWRMNPYCPIYEYERIQTHITTLVHLMRRNEIYELMYFLKGNNINRNQFGLLHPELFTKAIAGTKVLVETYHHVVCSAFDYCCDATNIFITNSNNNNTNNRANDIPVVTSSSSSSSSSSEEEAEEDDDQDDFDNHDDEQQQQQNNHCTDSTNTSMISTETRLAFFNETRHAYGRTALLLSGGAALGMYHVGVVKALMENDLLPRVIGGSSAGSIVSAMIGTRTDDECYNDLFHIRGTTSIGHSGHIALNFFKTYKKRYHKNNNNKNNNKVITTTTTTSNDDDDDHSVVVSTTKSTGSSMLLGTLYTLYETIIPSPIRYINSFLYDCIITGDRLPYEIFKHDTDHLRDCIRTNVGNFTFQEAFDRTGRILNIVVTPNNQSDPPRLLNYLTAPHVLVWSAAVASSSLPGVFDANRLMVKDVDGTIRYENSTSNILQDDERVQHFSDGSLEEDLPMQQLSEMFNVNHFIISQANPQAVLLAGYNQRQHSIWSINIIRSLVHGIVTFLGNQIRSWFSNLIHCIGARVRIAPFFHIQRNTGSSFFIQECEGRIQDISLIPWINHRNFISALCTILHNPTVSEIQNWILHAERITWKYIPAIKSHIAQEMTLDHCVQRLRKRLIQETTTTTTTCQYHQKQQQEQSCQQPTNEQHEHEVMTSKTITNRVNSNGTNGNKSRSSMMKHGVPSFFTSPSLVHMGGFNVADANIGGGGGGGGLDRSRSVGSSHGSLGGLQMTIDQHQQRRSSISSSQDQQHQQQHVHGGGGGGGGGGDVSIQSGWGGMGLSGNRRNSSSGSLLLIQRSPSDASGLYIDGDDHYDNDYGNNNNNAASSGSDRTMNINRNNVVVGMNFETMEGTVTRKTTTIAVERQENQQQQQQQQQVAGERTSMINNHHQRQRRTTIADDGGYVKTTSMANFYYRRRGSSSRAAAADSAGVASSSSILGNGLSGSSPTILREYYATMKEDNTTTTGTTTKSSSSDIRKATSDSGIVIR